MDVQSIQLHFVLFPFLAQGHMIPMVDIAKLLAQQGAIITIFTTPLNAKRFATPLSRAKESGLQIQVLQVPLPSQPLGFPQRCENMDMLPSLGAAVPFLNACQLLQQPVEALFEQLKPRPSCVISDVLLPYTSRVARKFGIPRIIFNGCSCFCMECFVKISAANILDKLTCDSESFVVPGLANHIEMTKNQLPGVMMQNSTEFFSNLVADADKDSYGLIINTFEELEAAYVAEYKKVKQVWCIGPVSLCNKDDLDKVNRGNKAAIDESYYLMWLDSQKSGSVIYVSLGSLCNLIPSQLIELGLGLEASNRPFIWVIGGGETSKELEKWIEEDGFEERTRDRGLLIRGWSPQVVILSHRAIGGFLTHCGWNSTLEAICAGLPMITWPLFGDQFLNEKQVVDVLRIGVKVGAQVTLIWGLEETFGVLVTREDVKRAIDKLMDDGEECLDRRKRAKELSRIAKEATEEGGSSDRNIKLFIQDILQLEMLKRQASS